jgi:hypothetical protein
MEMGRARVPCTGGSGSSNLLPASSALRRSVFWSYAVMHPDDMAGTGGDADHSLGRRDPGVFLKIANH